MNTPACSIIIPIYKSERYIADWFNAFGLSGQSADFFEVIFVNDASPDSSEELILEFRKKSSHNIQLVSLIKNYGQYTATVCGLSLAKGQYLITMDADMVVCLPVVLKTVQHGLTNDIAYAEFEPLSSTTRMLGTKIINSFIRRSISRNKVQEKGVGSSLRIIKAELAQKVLAHIHNYNLLDVELINQAQTAVLFIPFTGVSSSNSSSYSGIKLVKQALKMIFAGITSKLFSSSKKSPKALIKTVS